MAPCRFGAWDVSATGVRGLAGVEASWAERRVVRFAVLGDLHYVHREAEGAPVSAREYYALSRDVILPLLRQVRAQAPDFIVHTGDIVEGHLGSEAEAEAEIGAVIELLQEIAPTFFARGNHDASGAAGRVYARLIPRHHGRLLGRAMADGTYCFTFRAGPAEFIVTNTFCAGREAEQRAWLEEALSRPAAPRRFVVGHGPLFPVGRPFFTHLPFCRGAAELIHRYGADAYFCGHTHNQLVTLHEPLQPGEGTPILQCKGSLVGTFDAGRTVSLARARRLVGRGEAIRYFWGLLEDGWPGWFLVTASAEEVVLEGYYWSSPETWTRGVLRWQRPGAVDVLELPQWPGTRAFQPEDLGQVKRAWLRLCGYKVKAEPPKEVLLNGQPIGALPGLGAFAPRPWLSVPEWALGLLRIRNEVLVRNPAGESFCLGGGQLILELRNGERVLSLPDPRLWSTDEGFSDRDHVNLVFCRDEWVGPMVLAFEGEA